jgi:hypothetical protein
MRRLILTVTIALIVPASVAAQVDTTHHHP